MLSKFQLLRNIGQFDSYAASVGHDLAPLSLIYAENGRGKTTLAAILRSLAANDPLPIAERQRLGSTHPPHVVISCNNGSSAFTFENNAWNNQLADVAVFDDLFVEQNIYSGLTVGTSHRQKLHELILGADGVTLNATLKQCIADIEAHNKTIREKSQAIPAKTRGNFNIDDFCALPEQPDIASEIKSVEQALAAAQASSKIASTFPFDPISLPAFDLVNIESILQRGLPDLATQATIQVEAHFEKLGKDVDAESWVGDGMDRFGLNNDPPTFDTCPFCDQSLETSTIINHYREYFSTQYAALKDTIYQNIQDEEKQHGGDAHTAFERAVRIIGERRQFWSEYCDVIEVSIDTEAIIDAWKTAHLEVGTALLDKNDKPLETFPLPTPAKAAVEAYELHRQCIATINTNLQKANQRIAEVKRDAADADINTLKVDLDRLKAIQARHEPDTSTRCKAYTDALVAKTQAEKDRDDARDALDAHRVSVFPKYEQQLNRYLQVFNVGFRLRSVKSNNTRGGSTCSYEVVINNNAVPIAGGNSAPGSPAFHNTLSAGDRNTLALAFFCASLDLDSTLSDKIVVVDDPMTSLDEHRSLTTVQQICGLVNRTRQVIVLSHSKSFLCNVWHYADRSNCAALRVIDGSSGSTMDPWTIKDEAACEYDRHHQMLRDFVNAGQGDERVVAEAIRFTLEGFLRRACPEHFLPGEVLGDFRRRVGNSSSNILSTAKVTELDAIAPYANQFHHGTNPAYRTVNINRTELNGWCGRTLDFVKV